MSGEACRGDPAFLFFAIKSSRGRGGGIPFLCGVERASQPGMAPGEGGWESPRASDLRRMSCVRILAQRVWSIHVRAGYSRCSYLAGRSRVLPWVGQRVFGEGADEDFQTMWHYVEVR